MLIQDIQTIAPSWKTLSVLALLAILIAAPLMSGAAAPLKGGYVMNWLKLGAFRGLSSWVKSWSSGGMTRPEPGFMKGGKYQLLGSFWQATSYLIRLPLVVVFASDCVGQFTQGLSRVGSTMHIFLCKKLVRIFPDIVYELFCAVHLIRGRKIEEPLSPL